DGDLIEINSAQIDEDLLIRKSLTLVPSPGHVAIIGESGTTRTITVQETPGGKPVDVYLNQIFVINGRIVVDFEKGFRNEFTLRNSGISINDASLNAISLKTTTDGSRFVLEQNNIISNANAIALFADVETPVQTGPDIDPATVSF